MNLTPARPFYPISVKLARMFATILQKIHRSRERNEMVNGRNDFRVIAATRGMRERKRVEADILAISRNRSNELICVEDRQQFAGDRGKNIIGTGEHRFGRGVENCFEN